MSFLYKATPLLRTSTRCTLIRSSPRLFTTTVIQQKSATDTVKDGLKSVDRAVSDVAVSGIDKGVEIKDKAAAAAGVESQKATGTASEAAGEAKGTAQQAAGQAKGKAAELTGQAKGKAEEIKGKMS